MKYIIEFVITLLFITTIYAQHCQDGTLIPNIKNCAEFYLCRNNNWHKIPCPPYRYFNKVSNNCIPDDGTCLFVKTTPTPGCVSGTIKNVQNDCTKYMQCNLEKWIELDCPMHYYFNSTEKKCKLYDGTCNKTIPIPIPEFVHYCINGTYKVNENNTKQYSFCENGNWLVKNCTKNKYFNSTLEKCILDIENRKNIIIPTLKPHIVNCTEDTMHEDRENCTRYYVCKNKKLLLTTCPTEYYFNATKGICSKDDGSCNQHVPALSCDENAVKLDNNNCDKYFFCKNGNWSLSSCPTGYYFNSTNATCSKDDGSCNQLVTTLNCIENAVKQDKENCDKYFVCIYGNWSLLSCPTGYYFNAGNGTCSTDDGPCNKHAPTFNCTENAVKEDKDNCDKYFICKFGNWSLSSCPTEYYFNATNATCSKDSGSCNQHVTTLNCTEYTLKHDNDNCDKYFICKNGNWSISSCPTGYYFNATNATCSKDVGSCNQEVTSLNCTEYTLKLDNDNCDKYFICKNGNWSLMSCPTGYYFNATNATCSKDDGSCNQHVTSLNCTEYTVKQDEENCDKYFVCKYSKWSLLSCPTGYYFNASNGTCSKDDGSCNHPGPILSCEQNAVKQDTENCDSFFICKYGNWSLSSCPLGYYFNTTNSKCSINDGSCKKVIPTPGRPTKLSCTNGDLKYDTYNCNKYFLCKSGKWTSLDCKPGYYFSLSHRTCMAGSCNNIEPTAKPKKCKNCTEPTLKLSCKHGVLKEYPYNCNQYWYCSSGVWLVATCPHQYYFNVTNLICTPEDGSCTRNQSSPIPKLSNCSDGSLKINEQNCNQFFVCKLGEWSKMTCPQNFYFNSKDSICLPGLCKQNDSTSKPSVPKCLTGILKEDIHNCSKYYLCKFNNWLSVSCPINFYYNATQEICMPGSCGEKISIPITNLTKNCTTGSLKINEFNCTKYYMCKFGNWSEMTCPNKSYFNLTRRSCIPGSCIKKQKIVELEIVQKCMDNQRRPDPENCSKYYLCISGNWLLKLCPSNYYFNKMKNVCAINDGVCYKKKLNDKKCQHGSLIADPFNCTKYLFCKLDSWLKLSCPEGYQFNINLKMCIPGNRCLFNKEIKGIKQNICNTGTVINDINNCTQFYHCQSNHWYLYSCPDKYYFDTNTNQCILNDGICCSNGIFMVDQNDVNKFYQCKFGKWQHNSCPLYHQFDIDQKICIMNAEN